MATPNKPGRRPLPLAFALVTLAAAMAAGAPPARGQISVRPDRGGGTYVGTSPRGDLQEALNDAVERALRARPGADRMVRYRVREITGERGGIAGVNVLRVTIEVAGETSIRPPGRPAPDPGDRPPAGVQVSLGLSSPGVRRNGEVTLALTVVNRSSAPVALAFATTQKYDFEVRQGERVVWQWSRDRAFAQVLTQARLQPGERVVYQEKWNVRNNDGQPVPAGAYTARGILTVQGPRDRPQATARLVVEE
jgi:hypothetical protein